MVVEDNDLNMKLFRDLLEAHGYETVTTRDGRTAIDLIKDSDPDLILMDIQLPEISGLDLIKEIKSNAKYSKIPIIAVTAFAMREDEEKILASGCESYIAKPIAIDSFIEKVQRFAKG